jgi:hypothetical protein
VIPTQVLTLFLLSMADTPHEAVMDTKAIDQKETVLLPLPDKEARLVHDDETMIEVQDAEPSSASEQEAEGRKITYLQGSRLYLTAFS